MNAPRTARERARIEITAEIVDAARRQVAEVGAAGLSLRAVARELGMVSSALYRYFPSRDELLTRLIVDAYDSLGEAAERADAACRRNDVSGRWRALCDGVRAWAKARPHEYALLYGTPVPGYRAPQDTIDPATRVPAVLGRLLTDAADAGVLAAGGALPIPRRLRSDVAAIRGAISPTGSDDLVIRGVIAWIDLFGVISFELFGQFQNVFEDLDTWFDHVVDRQADLIGLPPTRRR